MFEVKRWAKNLCYRWLGADVAARLASFNRCLMGPRRRGCRKLSVRGAPLAWANTDVQEGVPAYLGSLSFSGVRA